MLHCFGVFFGSRWVLLWSKTMLLGASLVPPWCNSVQLWCYLGASLTLLRSDLGATLEGLLRYVGASLLHIWCYLGESLSLLWSYFATTWDNLCCHLGGSLALLWSYFGTPLVHLRCCFGIFCSTLVHPCCLLCASLVLFGAPLVLLWCTFDATLVHL